MVKDIEFAGLFRQSIRQKQDKKSAIPIGIAPI
jgi:hypothetical protein